MKPGGTWTPGRAWTPDQDAEVRRLRATGLRWEDVGAQVGRGGSTCRQRITRILGEADPLTGAPVVPKPRKGPAAPAAAPPSAGSARYAMHAGDPVSWGAITAGTLLDGRPYR